MRFQLTSPIQKTQNKYDFAGASYASMYPNLHRYPATMLPQIGLELLKDFSAKKTNLLDPYCGSGSSFISGLEYGIKDFSGFDLNPLAVMISRAKLSFIETKEILSQKEKLLENIAIQSNPNVDFSPLKNITNLDFWIEKNAQKDLIFVFNAIQTIEHLKIKNIFMLAFSETLREVSYVRNNEFKLFRMKNYENYQPCVFYVFKQKLEDIVNKYLYFYQPKIKGSCFDIKNTNFIKNGEKFDTILTSPPYGDSRTTVAYGQFSTFINEWLGFKNARQLDSQLLGGKKAKIYYEKTCIKEYVLEIAKIDSKRALEISSFYFDLECSILSLISSIHNEGLVFFVIGNRTVKNITLPTDQFIAEILKNRGLKHLTTLKRKISNKTMPLRNSPSNQKGKQVTTMNDESIVVCQK